MSENNSKRFCNYLAAFAAGLFVCFPALGQSGGQFSIEQSVIANGGGNSSGGTFAVAGTSGQAAAGVRSSAPTFGNHGGFWQSSPLGPSAAYVSVAGRVLTSSGQGIRNVIVTISESNGIIQRRTTGSLGYFLFDTVEAGQTVVLSVQSKRYTFVHSPIVLNIGDAIDELRFTAEP